MSATTTEQPREQTAAEKRIQQLRAKGAAKRTDDESNELRGLVDAEKADRFLRVVPGRVQRALDTLDKLAHCGNRSTYTYTDDQVAKIAKALSDKMVEVGAAFEPQSAEERDTFSL